MHFIKGSVQHVLQFPIIAMAHGKSAAIPELVAICAVPKLR
jgi:hypothetical protein